MKKAALLCLALISQSGCNLFGDPVEESRSTSRDVSSPVITSPQNPAILNSTSIVLSGTCESGTTVVLTEVEPAVSSNPKRTSCGGSQFAFELSKSSDGIYTFQIDQRKVVSKISGRSSEAVSSTITFLWVLDRQAPSSPAISNLTSPLTSGANSITLTGSCENGSTLVVGGDASLSSACVSGSYSISIEKSADATYNFTVKQVDRAGNASTPTSFQWVRQSGPPSVPVISSPAGSTFYSNSTSLTISGSCTTGNSVVLGGDATQTTTCASSTFSFSVTQTTDQTYSFTVHQTDSNSNSSNTATQTWILDRASPSTPVVDTPSSSPVYSRGNSLTLSGGCENAATVYLSGSETQSVVCSSSSFSFSVNKSTDGTYDLVVSQTDRAGNSSSTVARQWIRDTDAPTAPTISSPTSNPYSSGESSFTVSGLCENGSAISLSGDSSSSVNCSSGTYSLNIAKSSDGTYNFEISSTDTAGNVSHSTPFQWIRSSSNPAPTLGSPTSNPAYTNGSSLTISGDCTSGNTVTLGGADSQTFQCSSSSYSFTTSASIDGTYHYTLVQDNGSTASPTLLFTWVRDTSAGTAPTFVGGNPFVSGDSTYTIRGNCESGSTVALAGADTGSTTCVDDSFTFDVTHASAGTYDYTATQTDAAGNISAEGAFTWVKDGTMPATPGISSPTIYTTYSNASSIILSGSCSGSNVVTLSGDVSASEVTGASLTTTCSSGAYSFTVNKSSDGTYNLSVHQTDSTTLNNSAARSRVWVRDTSTPAVPVLANPSILPYNAGGTMYLTGSCEDGTTVELTGDSTLSTTCTQSQFSFTVSKSTDATYNFTIKQRDAANNLSTGLSVQWIRDSSIPPAPRIYSPPTTPFYSKASQLLISGSCSPGMTAILSGDVVAGDVTGNSLSQVCPVNGQWQFTVTKASDGTFNFNIKQRNGANVDSPASVVQWIKDTTGPVITIGTKPSSTNLSQTATFTFSADEAVSGYMCSLDNAAYSPCTSPVSYSGLSNGSHSFGVKATDLAQNLGSATTYSWSQSSGKTVALYHFDTSPGVEVDSSNYSSTNNNALTTNTGTSAGSTAKFSQSLSFGASSQVSSTHTNSQALLTSTMTVEMWFSFTGTLSNNNLTVLASKSGPATPTASNWGWQMGLKRLGSNTYIVFDGSTNGTTFSEVRSTAVTVNSGTWYHLAVTFNRGSVSFYLDGAVVGTSSISGSGSVNLFSSTAPLRLGATDSTQANVSTYRGLLDEVRISQVVRYVGAFTKPSAAFSAD